MSDAVNILTHTAEAKLNDEQRLSVSKLKIAHKVQDEKEKCLVSEEKILRSTGNTLHAKCRRTFGQDHIFYINSISNNSDAQTFISADTFRINLSNLEVSDRSFNLIDMKPPNMQYALALGHAHGFSSNCNIQNNILVQYAFIYDILGSVKLSTFIFFH
ncbi:hypothetical protein K1719_021851 [Acacia pycnantha]|nr:hypothetical protein K1719_021851 [Acacia pycnantha]